MQSVAKLQFGIFSGFHPLGLHLKCNEILKALVQQGWALIQQSWD